MITCIPVVPFSGAILKCDFDNIEVLIEGQWHVRQPVRDVIFIAATCRAATFASAACRFFTLFGSAA
jgi:hypothetical protein